MIEACCKQLKIGSTFYKGYKDIKADTHEQFLLELLKRELENREIVRKNRLLKTANFDVVKTFQGYTWDQIQVPPSISIEDIKAVKFVEQKANLVSECYERRSVIITTNLEFSKWNAIFYDEKMTSAIIDRLIHHSHLLVFNGLSYRLQHSTINC